MKVPFFDYQRVFAQERFLVEDSIFEVLERSDFILRQDLLEFERKIIDFLGGGYFCGVGNGTDAITIALLAIDIQPGDEVILPAHTYIATAGAVRILGATPVLVDCEPSDHLISVSAVRESITSRTKAIIPVNLNGRAANLEEIVDVARRHKIFVIEDNAQGFGAKLDGKLAGTFGDLSTFSFFPAKILGCYGDGGGVFSNDAALGEKVEKIRNHGRNSHGEVVMWGINSRLDNLQAAILSSKLNRIDDNFNRRRDIAMIYFTKLKEVKEITLPPKISYDEKRFDVFQNFEVEVEDREALIEFLKSKQVGISLPWGGKALHQFGLDGLKEGNLNTTNRIFERVCLLPMNQYLTDKEVEYVCDMILQFYRESR